MKKILLFTLVFLLAFALMACGGGNEQPTAGDTDVDTDAGARDTLIIGHY